VRRKSLGDGRTAGVEDLESRACEVRRGVPGSLEDENAGCGLGVDQVGFGPTLELGFELGCAIHGLGRLGSQSFDVKFYEARDRNLQIAHLKRKAVRLGFRITELAA
jgi:hypothetical protein